MNLPPLPDLKPCPFCGSTNISTDDARDFVSCLDCYTEGPCNPGQGSAANIAAWNRRAALAAVPAQPMTSERHFALREAHCIGASDAYFKAWPTHDNDAGRMLFERGFVRGFDSHERIAAAPQAVPVPADMALTDDPWRKLYRRAINEANGLTNYVEDRPELRGAERRLAAIEAEARTLAATFEPTPEKKP